MNFFVTWPAPRPAPAPLPLRPGPVGLFFLCSSNVVVSICLHTKSTTSAQSENVLKVNFSFKSIQVF